MKPELNIVFNTGYYKSWTGSERSSWHRKKRVWKKNFAVDQVNCVLRFVIHILNMSIRTIYHWGSCHSDNLGIKEDARWTFLLHTLWEQSCQRQHCSRRQTYTDGADKNHVTLWFRGDCGCLPVIKYAYGAMHSCWFSNGWLWTQREDFKRNALRRALPHLSVWSHDALLLWSSLFFLTSRPCLNVTSILQYRNERHRVACVF